ncbi:hypothetical protein PMAC_003387 [Pneumocystis sp. 'macacae']|nr:hypothetical protein PMAC_003387 [Pneumocystis sp. 'macacae']
MSIRNLRKLKKLQEDKFLSSIINEDSNCEISLEHSLDVNILPSNNFNRFSILNDNIQTIEDSILEGDSVFKYENRDNIDSKKCKIKRKYKNKGKNINKDSIGNQKDHISEFLKINKIDQSFKKYDFPKLIIEDFGVKQQEQLNLLVIDQNFLDPDAEMRKLFGKMVLDDDNYSKKKSKKYKTNFKNKPNRSPLMVFKESWPPFFNNGLSMDIIDYALDILNLSFPRIIKIPNATYHVGTLLQVSEILKHQGNYQNSLDLVGWLLFFNYKGLIVIDRALYSLGRGFHPMFNISTGRVRLPFEYFENRVMYLALHKHIRNLEKKGCWRTAFEFNKLLLRHFCIDCCILFNGKFSLSPLEDSDNYGALLTIDFFALKAKEYDYIIELREWYDQNYLRKLPSFAFSYALALFYKENKDNSYIISKEKIVEAAFSFPWVIKSLFLLLKLSVPNGYELFSPPTNLDALYMDIYLSRAKDIWNTSECLEFLGSVLFPLPLVNKNFEKFDYGIPAGILRYVLLSENKNLIQYLPSSITSQPIMEYDPFPPHNSTLFTHTSTSNSSDDPIVQENYIPINSSEILLSQL